MNKDEKSIKEIFKNLSEGKRNIIIKYPDYDKEIRAEINQVDLRNIVWKPIHVKILTKGLSKEEKELVEVSGFGFDETGTELKIVNRPYEEDWVSLEFIKGFE